MVKNQREEVKKAVRHPVKGLLTVLLSSVCFLAFLGLVTALVNFVME